MIYTVTFNPSLDYIVSVDNFRLGLTNRTNSELLLPGGKGINVSTVLGNLGIENTEQIKKDASIAAAKARSEVDIAEAQSVKLARDAKIANLY